MWKIDKNIRNSFTYSNHHKTYHFTDHLPDIYTLLIAVFNWVSCTDGTACWEEGQRDNDKP